MSLLDFSPRIPLGTFSILLFCTTIKPKSNLDYIGIKVVNYMELAVSRIEREPEVPQSPDARLSLPFIVRGFISIINIAKMQEKIQRD